MTKLLKYIRDNIKIISVIFYFVITALIISFIFPKQGKFRYDFQKGRPWMHQDLTAEFDFPIRKSVTNLGKERDSVLSDFKPYFIYDTTVYYAQETSFVNVFTKKWNDYTFTYFKITNSKSLADRKYDELNQFRDKYIQIYTSFFNHLYTTGIIELNNTRETVHDDFTSVMIVKNNIAEAMAAKDLYSLREAYEYLKLSIKDVIVKEKSPLIKIYKPFFNQFDFNRFIVPNINYDKEKSLQAKNNLMNKISLYRDKVLKGQLIISSGELVTAEKYQILESLRDEYETRLGLFDSQLVTFGKFILICVALLVIFLFLYNLRKEILYDSVKTIFILLLVILVFFIASTTVKSNKVSIYIIPFVIIPIIIRNFYDERLALFIHFICTILVGLLAPTSFEFVFITFISGIIAVFTLTNFSRRSKIVYTAVVVFFTYCVTYFGFSMVQEGYLKSIDYNNFKWFGINSLLILLSFPLIYIFEKTFGFLSDATLMELADTNQPLLRELAEKTPGTFQHSLQVANLAEDAIFKIGGNSLLVRTGALYHDIGKLENPIYFIENQTSGINPHDNLTFEESAKVIINHVVKGVEIAKKYKLPPQIIDFIATHHGTTTVQYFYRSYIKKYPDEEVDRKRFMYPGPRPFSKETAVVMMADTIEAASRSLKEINENAIDTLVDTLIDTQLMEEQFNNADLTFKDISTIKDVFKRRLRNIYHYRITYPSMR